jgi:hypothetical protein
MPKYFALIVLVYVALGCSFDPSRIKVAPDSPFGLLAFKVDRIPENVALYFQQYDPDTHEIVHHGFLDLNAKFSRSGNYLVAKAPPGNYVMLGIGQQWHWIVCMHKRTIAVQVMPGEVEFAGTLVLEPNLAQLQSLGSMNPASINGEKFIYGTDILSPTILQPTTSNIAEVQSQIEKEFKFITAPVRAVQVKRDYFIAPTYSDGRVKRCGVLS